MQRIARGVHDGAKLVLIADTQRQTGGDGGDSSEPTRQGDRVRGSRGENR
jgi:hypothetical protein